MGDVMEKRSNDTFEKYMEALKQRQDIYEKDFHEMFSGYDYMDWLVDFTNMYNDFSDDSWLYNQDGITKEERKKVFNLSILFHGIKNYCERNYLYPVYKDLRACA